MGLTCTTNSGSNALIVETKHDDICPHALVLSDAEDQALKWLFELFKAMETKHGASMFYGRTAKATIEKIYNYAKELHKKVHDLEDEVDQFNSIFQQVAGGQVFIAPKGEA